MLPDSFYETSITLTSKPGNDITKKENYRPITPDEYRQKNSQHNTHNQNQQHNKKIIHHDQVGFIAGIQELFNIYE
jgi:hypothetical protein